MRILLGQNSQYYPAHGGGDKSNRLLIEALAARGHACRVVARISVFGAREQERYIADLAARGVAPADCSGGAVRFTRAGVDVHVVTVGSLGAYFAAQIGDFRPDAILTSTDDPAQVLLVAALRGGSARVIYLARATLALPFGPDCAFPSDAHTERIRAADRAVGVSQYVADYMCRYGGVVEAVHVPISLMDPGPWRVLGRFENEFVTLVNPCAVKGISIFLALADAFPETLFAAVPTWGTNEQDRAALEARANVRVLDPVDDIDVLLGRTRVLLVPSLWAEARSRIVLEAMLRGDPVMASNTGGIPEAKMGVPYLLPVNPIAKYQPRLDEQMVPVAEVPQQDLAPWREALGRLLSDRAHYEEIAQASRKAALGYAENLSAGPFERLLVSTTAPSRSRLRTEPRALASGVEALSAEKRRLLALRLRKRAPAAAWFPNIDAVPALEGAPRLFWFPHAGAGTGQSAGVRCVFVRLPGRESRIAEAPFERMGPLVEALANVIEPYTEQPFAFFGHSMGAVVAFELARTLRRRGLPLPKVLIASAARAPQYRRNHVPPPAPTSEELLAQVDLPPEFRDDPAALRAILPALEADTTLYRHYVYSEEPPLDFPIRAYGGTKDPHIRREHLDGWAEQTTASFAVRLFPGGHLYLRTAEEFRAALESDLRVRRLEQGVHYRKLESELSEEKTAEILAVLEQPEILDALERAPIGTILIARLGDKFHPARYDGDIQRVAINSARKRGVHYGEQFRPGLTWSMSGATWNKAESMRRSLLQEVTHHIEASLPGIERLVSNAWANPAKRPITRYAADNRHEYFAESLLAYLLERNALAMHDPTGTKMIKQAIAAMGR